MSDMIVMSSPPITPEQLATLPPEFRALFQAVIDHYENRIVELEHKVGHLESQLKKSPRNSSLPPSSEAPARQASAAEGKKWQEARRPARSSQARTVVDPDRAMSEGYHGETEGLPWLWKPADGSGFQPLRHQVWEIPEIKPLVTEYQRRRLNCPCCGISTCGQLPAGVPHSQAGPRLVALTALLMGCFKQSKRRVSLFLQQVLNQPCSPGWVVKLQDQATAAITPAYDELAAQLPKQLILGIDESPTKQAQAKGWLWTFVAASFTVFTLRTTRAATVLQELLTDAFGGVVNCDRAKMYWSVGRPQWCWAHLQRDFQALIDHPNHTVKRLGQDLMRPTKELFRLWARCRDGTLSRAEFEQQMQPIRTEIDGLLLRGVFSGNKKLKGMCKPLFAHRDWLWTFLDINGVQPTNNASERALRPAVIWRKLSFGTQSANGSRFVEKILTVVETCHRQSRNSFQFLTETLAAHFNGHTTPSLLTTP